MADDKLRTIIEADLSEESSQKLSQDISDSIEKGLEGKEESFNQVFNFKNIKKDLGKSLIEAFGKSSKVQARQAKAMDKYKEAQEAVKTIVSDTAGKKGFGGILKLVGAIGKQGMAGAAGMAANINPYVLAIQAAAEAVKFTADQFERIAKESAKFVGQGSLFTDKETITMMQRTGQTGTQAQATQRSLLDLGLTFEDIQRGKITAEQAAAFEQIRQRELNKLEEINKVAGPMFKSMQQVSLGFTLLLRDINDFITMAMANAPGIQSLLDKIKPFIAQVGAFMDALIGTFLEPIFSIVGDIAGFVIDLLAAVMPAIQSVITFLQPILQVIQMLSRVIFGVLSPMFKIVGLIGSFGQVLLRFLVPLGSLSKLLEFINPLIDELVSFIDGFAASIQNFFADIFDTLKSIPIIGELFSGIDIPRADGTGAISSTNSTFNSSQTINYNYGSQSMSQASVSPADLFSNSYILVND